MKIINNLKVIILGVIISLGTGYVLAVGTWNAPGCAAPGCNVDQPINTGSTIQYKDGPLEVKNTLTAKDLVVETSIKPTVTGQSLVSDGITGKVKWGTALGGCEIQHGKIDGLVRDVYRDITFSKQFSSTPNVVTTSDNGGVQSTVAFIYVSNVGPTGFRVTAQQNTSAQWIAIAGNCF